MNATDFKSRYVFDPQRDFLGEGSYSRVYRAVDTLLQRDICIKLFRKELTAGSRLIQELNRAGVYFHPQLCAFYDLLEIEETNVLGEAESQPIGVVEYINGGNAVQYAATHDTASTKQLIKDYLKGISYLHSLGKPHLNLKPENLLVKTTDKESTGKITDFLNQENLHTDTSSSAIDPRSLCYKAPECFDTDSGESGFRADIWSLGVIVYEMATGTKLFLHEHDSPERVIRNICHQDYQAQVAKLDDPFRSFVTRCLMRDAAQRDVSIEELTLILDGVKSVVPAQSAEVVAAVPAMAVAAATAPPMRAKEKVQKGGLSLPIIALALLLLGGISAFMWRIVGRSKPHTALNTTAIDRPNLLKDTTATAKLQAPTIIHDTVKIVQVIETKMPPQFTQVAMAQNFKPVSTPPPATINSKDIAVPVMPGFDFLYTGKSYYFDLKTPLLSEEEFTLVSDRATVTTLGKNTFYLKPYNEPGSINVMVLSKKDRSVLAQRVYTVRNRPLPVATIGDDITGGIVSPKLLLAKLTLQAQSDNGNYKIKSFRMTCKTGACDIDDVSNDGRFNESMIKFLHNVKSGEKLYFDNIVAEDESGQAVKLNDFQITTY